MAHVEDRWTQPTGKVDHRGRPVREKSPRYGIGNRYIAIWTTAGRRQSKTFPTKDAANAHLGEVAQAQRLGTFIGSQKTTVAEFGDAWILTQIHLRPTSATALESRWRIHLRTVLGHLRLSEVTRQHVQSAVTLWATTMSPASVAACYGYLAAMFKAAADDRVIPFSPCVRINLPAVRAERVVPLTAAQVHEIADRVPLRYRMLVLLGAATGMRSAELRGLTTDRLLWAGDVLTVYVDRQLTGTGPSWGPPKTTRSDRSITVDDVTAGLLLHHLTVWPPAHPSGIVFTTERGAPVAKSSASDVWNTAVAGMDLPDRSGWHALRHHHASLLIAAGLSVTAVADRLGHQDPAISLRIYSHLWPTDESRMTAAVANQLWS